MADYKSSIGISIKLDPQNKLKNDLDQLLNKLSETSKVNLDINIKDSNITNQLKNINDLANNLKKNLSGSVTFGNIDKSINQINTQAEKLNGELLKVSRTNLGNGLYKQTEQFATSIGEVTKQTGIVQKMGDDFNYVGNTIKTVTSNMSEYNDLLLKVAKAQESLSGLKLVDQNKVNNLSNFLSGNNVGSSNELKNYLNQVKELENEENRLKQIQKEELDLINQMANAREKSQLKSQQSDRNQELAQAKAINQALQDNYQASLKEVEAQKQVQQELEKQIRLLDIQKQSLTRQYGNKIDTTDIDNAVSKLKSMNNINMNDLRNEISNIKIGIKEITEQARNSESLFGKLGNSLRNVGIYIDITDVVRGVTNSIKDATDYVIRLDSAMTNLKKVTQETNQVYSQFLNQAHNIAMDYGSQADKVVDATTSWAKTGESLKDATELAKSTMLLTKVGDIENVATAQQYMIAPLKAFHIEAEKSITLIDKYNNISNNMATSTNDLGEALSKSASSMATAGNTLEQTLALIATAESQTKLGGSVVGQAFKTVSLRIATFEDENGELIPKFEERLKSLGVTMRDTTTGQILPTFEILRQVGEKFKTLDTNTKLDISQLLGGKLQANVVSSVLNNVDELNRAYQLSTNSANSAINEFNKYQQSIQYSIDRLKESINNLYTNIISSGGLKAFVDGLTNIVSAFGNMSSVVGIATTALLIFKGQAIMGAVQSIGGLIAGESALTVATTGATLAWEKLSLAMSANPLGAIALIFTGTILLINKLKNAQTELIESNKQVINSYNTEKESINQANKLFTEKQNLENQIANTNEGTRENKELKEKLLDVEKQLAQVLPNSASGYDEQGKAISANNKLIQAQIDLKNKQLQQDSLKQLKDNTTMFDADIKSFKNMQQTLENYKKSRDEVTSRHSQAVADGNKLVAFSTQQAIDDYNREISEMETSVAQRRLLILQLVQTGKTYKEISDYIGESEDVVKSYTNSVQDTTEKTEKDTKSKEENVNKTNILTQANKELQNSTNGLSDDTIKKITEAYPEVENNADKAKAKVEEFNNSLKDAQAKEIQEASDSYAESAESIAKCQGFLDKLNKAGAVTPQIAGEILKVYPELAVQLGDVSSLQDALNGKIQEQQASQSEAYLTMMQDDQNFYQQKIANNDEFKSAYDNFLSAFVADGNEAGNIDFNNYKTYAEFKKGSQHQLGIAIENWLTQYVGESAKGYATDFENFRDTASQKASVLKKLNDQIDILNQNLAGTEALKNTISARNNFYDIAGDNMSDPLKNFNDQVSQKIESNTSAWQAQIEKIKGAKKDIDTTFNEFGASMQGFSGGGLGGGSDFSGTGGGSGGSDKSAEKAQKLAEEIAKMKSEIEPDRYYELNNAIKNVDTSLTANKTLLDSLKEGTPEYQQAQLKDIELYKQKQVALQNLNNEQKKESEEIKNKLASMSFQFDANGKLLNSQKRLLEMQESINAMGGNTEEDKENKKAWIDWLKDIQKYTENYASLTEDTIPKTANEYNELANSIKKVSEELRKANEEAINSTGDKIVEGLKQEYEKKKTKELKELEEEKEDDINDLDDEIEALQRKLNDLDNTTADNETKLAKLKAERQLWLKDNSTESTKKISELDIQIADLQKTIQKDSIQSQIDELNEKKSNRENDYDEEKQSVEDKYEDLLDEHKLYNEAEEMLTSKNVDRIKELLSSQDESFKQIGTKLGSSLTDPIQTEIDKTLKAIDDLKTSVGISSSDTSSNNNTNSSSSSDKSKIWISDGANTQIYTDATGTETKGSLWSNGIASADQLQTDYEYSNGFYKIYDKDGNELGWVDRTQVNEWNDVASASDGGRTPSTISNDGAVMKLHKDEMITNANDTLKFDEMYNYIKNSGSLLSQLSQSYGSIGSFITPTLGTDLSDITSKIVNNNTTNTKQGDVTLYQTFTFGSMTDIKTKSTITTLAKQMKDDLRSFGVIK